MTNSDSDRLAALEQMLDGATIIDNTELERLRNPQPVDLLHIDPATCKPDDVFRIRVGDRETVAIRVDNDEAPWLVVEDEDDSRAWYSDSQVTVLHRLVPEVEAKTLDVPMQPWDALREAARVVASVEPITEYIRSRIEWLNELADCLEAEHRAAQEKVAAAREAQAAAASAPAAPSSSTPVTAASPTTGTAGSATPTNTSSAGRCPVGTR